MKNLLVLAAVGFICAGFFISTGTIAAASMPTGNCVAIMSLKSTKDIYMGLTAPGGMDAGGGNWVPSSNYSVSEGSVDSTVQINFENKKININKTNKKFTLNTANDWKSSGSVEVNSELIESVDFSVSDGPLPGSYLITAPANTIPNLIFMPVNSGNTFLIQAKNSRATGVCQKV